MSLPPPGHTGQVAPPPLPAVLAKLLHINACFEVGPLGRTGQVGPHPLKLAPTLVMVKLAGANFTGG